MQHTHALILGLVWRAYAAVLAQGQELISALSQAVVEKRQESLVELVKQIREVEEVAGALVSHSSSSHFTGTEVYGRIGTHLHGHTDTQS